MPSVRSAPMVRWAKSWHTPLRFSQASEASVVTTVEPGTYSICERSRSHTARAAPSGARSPAAATAIAVTSSWVAVLAVCGRYSLIASVVADTDSASQPSPRTWAAGGGPPAGLVVTTARPQGGGRTAEAGAGGAPQALWGDGPGPGGVVRPGAG